VRISNLGRGAVIDLALDKLELVMHEGEMDDLSQDRIADVIDLLEQFQGRVEA